MSQNKLYAILAIVVMVVAISIAAAIACVQIFDGENHQPKILRTSEGKEVICVWDSSPRRNDEETWKCDE